LTLPDVDDGRLDDRAMFDGDATMRRLGVQQPASGRSTSKEQQ
jgi:hypothetical protein